MLQVGDTRFAIRCNYSSFTKWLIEKHGDFLTDDEPHLRLNIRLVRVRQGQNSGVFRSIVVNRDCHEHGELGLSVVCSHPAYFFWPMLQICLRCAINKKQPPDLLVHSSGIVKGGMAYLFLGPSGLGKSTICKLLGPEPTFTILHDDMVAVTQTDNGFHAWSTPLSGEMPAQFSSGAPIRVAFFLQHDRTNYATKLSRRKAVGLVMRNLVPPLTVTNVGLGINSTESLRLLLKLAEHIPCYELHFRPERDFWECIERLFSEDYAAALGKG